MKTTKLPNRPLNYKRLQALKKELDNNDNIQNMEIVTKRKIEKNKITDTDSKSFDNVNSLIEYLDTNNINTINDIEIKIGFNNKNYCSLKYDDTFHYWELSFDEQDTNINSLIYSLKLILRNSPICAYRKHRDLLFCFLGATYIIIFANINNLIIKSIICVAILLMILDGIFFENLAYKNNKFWENNRDSIILSIIFYILGVVTPYAINFLFQ